jgi:hypothetical protein
MVADVLSTVATKGRLKKDEPSGLYTFTVALEVIEDATTSRVTD